MFRNTVLANNECFIDYWIIGYILYQCISNIYSIFKFEANVALLCKTLGQSLVPALPMEQVLLPFLFDSLDYIHCIRFTI